MTNESCPRCGLKFDAPAEEVQTVNFESCGVVPSMGDYQRLCVPCGTLGCDGLLEFLRRVQSGYFTPEQAARAIIAAIPGRKERELPRGGFF